MKHDSNGDWFTAKDIKKLLNVSSGQLYHWGRTWSLFSPKIKSESRAYKDKYTFSNLLEVALVKELNDFGFDLKSINSIFNTSIQSHVLSEADDSEIWNVFKLCEADESINKQGGPIFLMITREKKMYSIKIEYLYDYDEENGIFAELVNDEIQSQYLVNLTKIRGNLKKKVNQV